ncbi:MAG: SAM-dependent methyltransferase [Sphingobium sp. 32-64-5]|nr:MAG: SAM-dependent methyltransferase [Sphingobium sp. 32-64-5]
MTQGRPWFTNQARSPAAADARLHAPATQRNRDAIAQVLARELPAAGLVVEVASGSGEHALYFAQRFPGLDWQPSDPDPLARASIAAWASGGALEGEALEGGASEGASAGAPANLRLPLALDAASPHWPVERAEALLCINMTHISPWEATLGLLAGAARILGQGAPLILYGPFLWGDVETAPSNLAFDAQLRARDARYGLRAVEELDQAAARQGLARTALHVMPANNLLLVYRVQSAPR